MTLYLTQILYLTRIPQILYLMQITRILYLMQIPQIIQICLSRGFFNSCRSCRLYR